MKSLARLIVVAVLGVLASSAAWAQFGNSRPNSGACFYVDYNFRGQSFCMNAGQDAATLPPGFGDRIRSIRVFGRAQVMFFNDSDFRGPSGATSRDINDLRQYPLPNDPRRNWAVRISSVRVTGGGFGGGYPGAPGNMDRDRDRDRDHDRDQGWYGQQGRDGDRDDRNGYNNRQGATVSCSSDRDHDREWCRTPGRVNSVRLVNQNGRERCEWGRTFGVDNGRLWTSHGCAGTFEIR
jgi:Protein of unknown function (DUF3011)/Peptidase inhibitor family I36